MYHCDRRLTESIFDSGFRKISKLLTGKPKDEVWPVELFLCGECGEVLNEVLPPGLKVEQE